MIGGTSEEGQTVENYIQTTFGT